MTKNALISHKQRPKFTASENISRKSNLQTIRDKKTKKKPHSRIFYQE